MDEGRTETWTDSAGLWRKMYFDDSAGCAGWDGEARMSLADMMFARPASLTIIRSKYGLRRLATVPGPLGMGVYVSSSFLGLDRVRQG